MVVNPKPDPPTGLTVQAGYDTGPFFTLNWADNDSSPPVAAYQVFRGGLAVAGTFLSQYTDRAAFTEGQLVQHRVTAVGTDGQISDPSTQITTAALGPPTVDPPPNAPTGLTVQPGYDTESFVAIDWADNPASPPVSAYNVTLNGNIVALPSVSSHRQGGLVAGTSYTVSVRAVGTDGQSSPATTAPAFIAPGAPTQPGVPTGLTVTPGFDTVSYFDMDWNDVATAFGYVVYVNGTSVPVPPAMGAARLGRVRLDRADLRLPVPRRLSGPDVQLSGCVGQRAGRRVGSVGGGVGDRDRVEHAGYARCAIRPHGHGGLRYRSVLDLRLGGRRAAADYRGVSGERQRQS